MTSLTTKLPWEQAQPLWASQINPILKNPVNGVLILKNVSLVTGTNVIDHLLGHTQQGWFLTDIQGPAVIYRNAAFNNIQLSLSSSANVTVNIGVF